MLRVYRRFIISTSHTFNLRHNFPQISHFSTSSSSSSNDFTDFLENSLGFSHQQSITLSTKLPSYNNTRFSNASKNAVSVVNLLKNYGFSDAHIRKSVKLYPRLLTCKADKTIEPKLGFLIHHGFSGIDLIEVVTSNPFILKYDVESVICPAIQVLRQILVSDALVFDVLKKLYLCNINDVVKNLSLNVALLTSYGVPIDSIRKHLAQKPGLYLRNPDTFKDVVIRVVEKIGNLPNSTMFLYGLRLFSGCSEEKIESKCGVFRSFGWSQTDIETLMMKNASVFESSEENIKKKLGFLMNDVGLEAAFLTSNSCLLTNSLEKKLLPRHNVLQILKAEGLLLKFPRFNYVVSMSESRFIKKFVLPFKDVRQVYARHVGCSVETLLQEHASDPR